MRNNIKELKSKVCAYLSKQATSSLLKYRELFIFKEVLGHLGPDCNYLVGCMEAIIKNKELWTKLKPKI